MTTANIFVGCFRLIMDGSPYAVRGALRGPGPQLRHHLDRLGLPWTAGRNSPDEVTGLGPWTAEQFKVWEEWAEPLRVDSPCERFDCHPSRRRIGRTYGRHAMNGCEHSIDFGPTFELELPYVDLVTAPLPFDPIIHVRVGD